MKVAITGANGFIGKNLRTRLAERLDTEIVIVTRDTAQPALEAAVTSADFIYHLAGVNRPSDPADFQTGNADLTDAICGILRGAGRRTPIVLSSSIQAAADNAYGQSKRRAEDAVLAYAASGARAYAYRLANVFGKWARPNYNSAVATFCHNIARGLPIRIDNADAPLQLVFIDNVVDEFVSLLDGLKPDGVMEMEGVRATTVGAVADTIGRFATARRAATVPEAAEGLEAELYATFMSAVPADQLATVLAPPEDQSDFRLAGLRSFGNLSLLRASPGEVLAERFLQSRTEKLFVLRGEAMLRGRDIWSGAAMETVLHSEPPAAIDLIPGLGFQIENVGPGELVMVIWSSEPLVEKQPKVTL